MIKDTKKPVVTYLDKEDADKLDKLAKDNKLSTSKVLAILVSGVLAYESGKSVGKSFGNFIFGKKD